MVRIPSIMGGKGVPHIMGEVVRYLCTLFIVPSNLWYVYPQLGGGREFPTIWGKSYGTYVHSCKKISSNASEFLKNWSMCELVLIVLNQFYVTIVKKNVARMHEIWWESLYNRSPLH